MKKCIDDVPMHTASTYAVTITEKLQRTIKVAADSEQEATEKIRKLYRNGSITLDADDFAGTEIDTALVISN